MRRDNEGLKKVYYKLSKNLLLYIEKLVEIGIDVISYADSATGVNILGEKILIQYLDDFVIDFLNESKKLIGDKTLIHICPKTTFVLIDSDRAEFIPIEVDENLKYGEAFEFALGRKNFWEQGVLKI